MKLSSTEVVKNHIFSPEVVYCIPGSNNKLDTFSAAAAINIARKNINKTTYIYSYNPIPHRLNFIQSEIPAHKPHPNYSKVQYIAFRVKNADALNKLAQQTTSILHIDTHESKKKEAAEKNIINVSENSSSVCETLTRLLKESNPETVTKEVSTALLAGIVSSTGNFQKPRVHPQTMFCAAYLLSKGGEHEKIVKSFYKTKPVEFIKLWGIALAKFSFTKNKNIGWTTITEDDLSRAGTKHHYVPQIINQLKNNVSQIETFVISVRLSPTESYVIVHSLNHKTLKFLSKKTRGSIHNHSLVLSAKHGLSPEENAKRVVDLIIQC